MKPQSPIVLDGKKVEELCVFGDGDAQLALYNAVKEYTLKNTTDIRRGMQPDKNPNYQCDVIVAKSARYDVVVARRYVPNVSTLFVLQLRGQIERTSTKENPPCSTFFKALTKVCFNFIGLETVERAT